MIAAMEGFDPTALAAARNHQAARTFSPDHGSRHSQMTPRPAASSPQLGEPDDLPQDVQGRALFFDVDGTLVDIADRPDGVVVPEGLAAALARLERRLGGAMALITGRSVAVVEGLFPGFPVALAGLHGAEWRQGGEVTRPEATPAFVAGRERLRGALAALPGTIFEDKGVAFAAHYRLAPTQEATVARLMAEIAAEVGEGWQIQPGKAVIELRPAGRSKGDALAAFMAAAPFAGRRPLAFGDDVTDEAMFRAALAAGGDACLIGPPRETVARHRLPSPAALRDWIARAAA